MNGPAGQTGCGGPPRWAGNWAGWVWIWTATQWCGILIWTESRWLVLQTSDSKCSAEDRRKTSPFRYEAGGLTQWSRMGEVTDRPQTQAWFPLRRPPPG